MNSELIERLREAGESAARIACRSVDPQPGLAANLVNEAADTLTTANETIARLEQQKADVTADYMRRHKDATDRFEEIIALKAQLATKEAELLACRADAASQFEKGWRTAANWVDRPDLLEDIGSPAYLADRDAAIKAGAQS